MSLKNPVTPPEINPGTVRLVAQSLNHYATPGPTEVIMLALNKKPKAKKCRWHCTIGLITHTGEIVSNILRRRIERKTEG
jgi:hypothetical protein